MSKRDIPRSVQEHYDEWCNTCDDFTEYTMGICLVCMHTPAAEQNARLKKKKTTLQESTIIMASGSEDSTQ